MPPALRGHKEAGLRSSIPPLSSNDQVVTKSNSNSDSIEAHSTGKHLTSANNKQRTRERRPDRAVYVPRARRSQTTPPASLNTKTTPKEPQSATCLSPASPPQQSSPFENDSFTVQNPTDYQFVTAVAGEEESSLASCYYSKTSTSPTEPVISAVTEFDNTTNFVNEKQVNISYYNNKSSELNCETVPSDTILKMAPKRGSLKIENCNQKSSTNHNKKDDGEKEEKELKKASQEMNRASKRIIKQTFNSNVLEIEPEFHDDKDNSANNYNKNNKSALNNKTSDKDKKTVNPEEDDWESMFDDNGDCLDPKMLDELTAQVGKVTIEKPKTDYKVNLFDFVTNSYNFG